MGLRAWSLTAALLALAGCTFEDKRSECSDDSQCPSGQSCYQHFCIQSVESDKHPATDGGKGGTASAGRGGSGGKSAAAGRGGAGTGSGTAGTVAGVCTGPEDCTVAAQDLELFNGCGPGRRACVDGQLAECRPLQTRTDEVCNGVDDDCDGTVDEAAAVEPCYPSDTKGCTGDGPGEFMCTGICKPGKRSCVNGVAGECKGAITPAPLEICGGATPQDDDCNGSVDDTCKCTNDAPCYDGDASELFTGSECKQGTQACIAGVLGLCLNQRRKTAETCANPGHDDDCNKIVDDIPNLNAVCSVSGMKGPCSAGKMMCVGTELTCVSTVMPAVEVCNDKDDDCDGVPDQTFNKLTDRSHCGACNHACATNEACKAGVCTLVVEPGTDAGT